MKTLLPLVVLALAGCDAPTSPRADPIACEGAIAPATFSLQRFDGSIGPTQTNRFAVPHRTADSTLATYYPGRGVLVVYNFTPCETLLDSLQFHDGNIMAIR